VGVYFAERGVCRVVLESNPDGTFKTTDGKPIKKDGSNAIPSIADGNQVFVTPTVGFILEF